MYEVMQILSVLEANFLIKTQDKENVSLGFTRFLNFVNHNARFYVEADVVDSEDPVILGKLVFEQLNKDDEEFYCRCRFSETMRGKKFECVIGPKTNDELQEESLRVHELMDKLMEAGYEKIRLRNTRGRHKQDDI